MSTSVRTKARKKQSIVQADAPGQDTSRQALLLEQAVSGLESVCVRILDSSFGSASHDPDRLYWQQRFKNVVTPISLALAEHRGGPRHFHNHYRHRADDESVLQPVLEDTLDMLDHVCEHALEECQKKLTGLRDMDFVRLERALEVALRNFLLRYTAYRLKVSA